MNVFAAAGPSAYWYLARATGFVSLLLLTATLVLGILGPLRFVRPPRWPRFAIDSLHRDISLLVLAFLGVHIVTSVLDSFAPIRLLDAVIPFSSNYRPLWLGFGAVSFDLLIALTVTSLLRRRLGYAAWRALHWLAYASWPVAVLHGLGTGSDTKAGWGLGFTAACAAAVVIATLVRVIQSSPDREALRVPAIALTVAIPVGIGVFTVVGPLQRGWARRAGTPASLLAKTVTSARAGASSSRSVSVASPQLRVPFSARLSGEVSQTPEPGGAVVDLTLRLSGGASGRLRVRLAGTPIDGGGLSMTGSQVDLVASGLPSVMQGRIVALEGEDFVARVIGGSEPVLDLRARLRIDGQTNAVTGVLSATPAGSGG